MEENLSSTVNILGFEVTILFLSYLNNLVQDFRQKQQNLLYIKSLLCAKNSSYTSSTDTSKALHGVHIIVSLTTITSLSFC